MLAPLPGCARWKRLNNWCVQNNAEAQRCHQQSLVRVRSHGVEKEGIIDASESLKRCTDAVGRLLSAALSGKNYTPFLVLIAEFSRQSVPCKKSGFHGGVKNTQQHQNAGGSPVSGLHQAEIRRTPGVEIISSHQFPFPARRFCLRTKDNARSRISRPCQPVCARRKLKIGAWPGGICRKIRKRPPMFFASIRAKETGFDSLCSVFSFAPETVLPRRLRIAPPPCQRVYAEKEPRKKTSIMPAPWRNCPGSWEPLVTTTETRCCTS